MIALTATMTLRDALAIAESVLSAAGIGEPRREARLLVVAALGIELADVVAEPSRALGEGASQVAAMLERRAAREPLSRIRGIREFYGLPFRLNPATLDPRSDTETLVDSVLERVSQAGRASDALRILDLCTGTGAILLALLHRLPAATGIGTDIAVLAIEAACENARALGLSGRAEFVTGDLFAGMDGRFDLIVSNPPYIPSGEIAALDPEVRLFDPRPALDGGNDGLDFYRKIASGAGRFLRGDGLLALEIGSGQAEAVAAILSGAAWSGIRILRDLGGHHRVILSEITAN